MSISKSGLHDRLNRISHWDVNVSNLERSRQWYESTTPLRVIAQTSADQEFPSLGISGRFEGLMLKDKNLPNGSPMIHLVEWKDPKPVGTPYESQGNVGWYRIVPVVEDIEQTRQMVIDQGSEPFAPTTAAMVNINPAAPDMDYRVFAVHDPDGITVEFGDKITMGPTASPQTPAVVAHNTSDVDKYISFYLDTLGLDFLQGSQTKGPVPNVYSPIGGETEFDGAFFGIRGGGTVFFDWLEWSDSRELSTPYDHPNHLGIMRCVIEVDDIDAAHEVLKNSPWSATHNIVLGPPEEWNYGDQWGVRKVLNFTDPEGVGFQLVQQMSSPLAGLHPYGYDSFPTP
jgi:catechol 2,3-dioxygenase-like lactoylglutathione lyase family enzyme